METLCRTDPADFTFRQGCSLCAFPRVVGNPGSIIQGGFGIQRHSRILLAVQVLPDFQQRCRFLTAIQTAKLGSGALNVSTEVIHRVPNSSSAVTGHSVTAYRYYQPRSIFKIMKKVLYVLPAEGVRQQQIRWLCCYHGASLCDRSVSCQPVTCCHSQPLKLNQKNLLDNDTCKTSEVTGGWERKEVKTSGGRQNISI